MKPHLNWMVCLCSHILRYFKYCFQVTCWQSEFEGWGCISLQELRAHLPFSLVCYIQMSSRQPADGGCITENRGLCEFFYGEYQTMKKNWVLLKVYLGKGLISKYNLSGSFFFRDIADNYLNELLFFFLS